MADEHETESKAWAIEAAAAEAASRAAEEVHRPPVVPMERVVDRDVIERGERAGRKRSQHGMEQSNQACSFSQFSTTSW